MLDKKVGHLHLWILHHYKSNSPKLTGQMTLLRLAFVATRPISYPNLVCIKMASILASRDLKHVGNFRNHCEVIILSTKFLARLKDQVESLAYKMFINETNFHRLFDCHYLPLDGMVNIPIYLVWECWVRNGITFQGDNRYFEIQT